jgi:hypothetical protein
MAAGRLNHLETTWEACKDGYEDVGKTAVRSVGLVLLACGAAGVVSLASQANGGSSIATASALPIGQQVLGGGPYTGKGPYLGWDTEFWRVPLENADLLKLDYSPTTTPDGVVGVCVMPPATTDYTLSQTRCMLSDVASGKREARFRAPSKGSWLLLVFNYRFGARSWSYELTAAVRHITSLHLVLPKLVAVKQRFAIHGTLGTTAGKATGAVAVSVRGAALSKPVSFVAPIAAGKFSVKVRLPRAGTYTVRAAYYGDGSHLSSRASSKLHVG